MYLYLCSSLCSLTSNLHLHQTFCRELQQDESDSAPGDAAVVPTDAPSDTRPVLDPSEYKKTVKLLKSSKLEKAIEGCEKAMDAVFVAKSGAIGPLMNLVVGHNKKVAEAAFPALKAIANYLDPSRGDGFFGNAGEGGESFTKNGIHLINKKSGGWKGAERIAQVLRNSHSVNDDTDPAMTSAAVTDEAVRCLASVVESFVAHGIGSSEEGIYRQKIRDLGEHCLSQSRH